MIEPKLKSHIEFCKSVAKGSTYKDAYKTYVSRKVGVSGAVCEKDGSLLAKKYAIYIQNLKDKILMAIDKAHENKAVKKAVRDILTVAEVDAILSKKIKGGDVRAIEIYYKRFGSFAPQKIAETDSKGNDKKVDLNALTDDELRELAKLQRKCGTGEA